MVLSKLKNETQELLLVNREFVYNKAIPIWLTIIVILCSWLIIVHKYSEAFDFCAGAIITVGIFGLRVHRAKIIWKIQQELIDLLTCEVEKVSIEIERLSKQHEQNSRTPGNEQNLGP